MIEALNIFIAQDSKVSTYQLEKLLKIEQESHIWESEEKMAISSIDGFKQEHIKNFNNHIDFLNTLRKAFYKDDILIIPSEFNDEIKTLDFLTKLGAKKSIKPYKNYINEKEAFNEKEESRHEYDQDIESLVKYIKEEQEIAKQKFRMTAAFYNFKEAFAQCDCYDDLKFFISSELIKYNDLKRKINDLAEDAISAIEDEEDIIESLEALIAFKGE